MTRQEPGLDIAPKAMAAFACLMLLIASSSLIHDKRHDPGSASGRLAAVSRYREQPSTEASRKRNNIFLVAPFLELKLFAPVMRPIVPESTQAVIKPHIKKIEVPTPKASINPLVSQFTGKNNDPERSVVNVICSVAEGSAVKQISSSGVLISPSGLILTNAHVGIHPFLAKYGKGDMTCKIRTGSPALTSHALDFIFISPTWTSRHRGETSGIVSADSGNGDFAILKATNPDDLLKFASPISIRNMSSINPLYLFAKDQDSQEFVHDMEKGQSVTAIGYPITGNNSASLVKRQEQLSVKDIFGFRSPDKKDLIETSASTIGKNGSSGGALTDSERYLVGILANVIPAEEPGTAYIRAISLDHINESLIEQTGAGLQSVLKDKGKLLNETFESRFLSSVKSDLLR